MSTGVFEKQTLIETSAESLFDWHARPGAIERLSPPWDPLEVLSRTGGIGVGDEVVMRMHAGPIPYRWQARHVLYEPGRCFRDIQIEGPFAAWSHTHRFIPEGPGRSRLHDIIEYRLPLHQLSGFWFNSAVERKLNRIFTYRHRTTVSDTRFHREVPGYRPLRVLISGAGGLIGTRLVPFLTTGGHRVFRLVRRRPNPAADEIFWDPKTRRLDLDPSVSFDAVVHLAGENIGVGRWTVAQRKRIIDSRVDGTTLLATAIAGLDSPPSVFICASAIGYYGDRGDRCLNETDSSGQDFISLVCRQWESAAYPAVERQIRTTFMRIGVVMDSGGGALARLLTPFQLGLGGRIGSGKQYISWVASDDVLGTIYHAMFDSRYQGPINVVAPEHVTNAEFTGVLTSILRRPALLPLPATVIRTVFGQQGQEILLSSTRVLPEKLIAVQYPFRFHRLEALLRHVLGR
jgi:uncharacterized protein